MLRRKKNYSIAINQQSDPIENDEKKLNKNF